MPLAVVKTNLPRSAVPSNLMHVMSKFIVSLLDVEEKVGKRLLHDFYIFIAFMSFAPPTFSELITIS